MRSSKSYWLSLLVLWITIPALFSSSLVHRRLAPLLPATYREVQELNRPSDGEKARDCDLDDVLCQTLVSGKRH